MSTPNTTPPDTSCNRQRRRWVFALGLLPAAGAVASVLPAAQEQTPETTSSEGTAQQSGYHETEHIRKYYRTARMM